ncbi:hypothetical protein GCM10023310_71070 [Paenibacillus vulneris]|uniref:Uncharacterized protein n=1 Tax=Paenibacillus vulneris TaxID=1133364 RepID=A0ABW3UI74_9BACL
MTDRLGNFLGLPSEINNVKLYSPTIDSIGKIGEVKYNVYLTLASFNKESILKNIFGVSDENYLSIKNENSFDVLTSIPTVVNATKEAISFFSKCEIDFDHISSSYISSGSPIITKENYCEFSKIIKRLNGINEEDASIKYKNEKTKMLHEKLLKLRAKYKKNENESLDLKDLLSILCNADGNGINIFNVGNLTIYQVYEHFERLNIKEQHTRLLKVWANGYLGKDDKLPEWIIKSKL